MENAIVMLENQLRWAEERKAEEKGYLAKTVERLADQKKSIEHYESLAREYQQALDLLRGQL